MLGGRLDFGNQMTTISPADIPSVLGLGCLYLVYRLIMVHGPLKSLARITRVKRPKKFIHRTFDALHYVVGAVVGLAAVGRRPYGHCFAWAKDCQALMRQNPDGFEVTVLEKIYFFLFFIYYAVDCVFIGTASETIMMVVHHVITLSEVTACVLLQSPVVALSIMLLHDVTDCPLYLGKFFIYLNVDVVPTVMLTTFALSVTYFRLMNLPIIVWHVWQVGKGTEIWPRLYYFESMCLIGLYGMHILWECKIIQAVVNAVGKKKVTDQRSD
jgi:hypothetical protein